jgi:hypothetical protein
MFMLERQVGWEDRRTVIRSLAETLAIEVIECTSKEIV